MTLMMSVSGVRGIVGETMTPELAVQLGAAFGSHLGGGEIIIGRDSRPSGELLESAVKSGLLAVGCKVTELGIVTTPGTALTVLERSARGGIVVTASHNPVRWNGIKFLTAEGFAPPPETVEKIFARYRERQFDYVEVHEVGRCQRDLSTNDRHVARVLRNLDVAAVRRRQLNVVLDSVNGAGGASGRMLLERCGCKVIHVNGEPTGRFAHPPEPTAENLAGLCDTVRQAGADIGFAQDPDADRLAIIDNGGRYIGEECTLALAAKYVFAKTPGPAAANLSTSRMIDDLAVRANSKCIVYRTPVGEANVARAVLEKNCVIGGEGNGGVIDPRVVPVRDSLAAMGLVLSLLAEDWRPFHIIVDELPRYVMIKQKFDVDRSQMDGWLERVRMSADGGRIDDSDGLRIDWPEGWVHVRPSNTEPIARVIAEASDEATAQSLARRITELR
jgi:phosphomannomutase